jgi:hypothetical protein
VDVAYEVMMAGHVPVWMWRAYPKTSSGVTISCRNTAHHKTRAAVRATEMILSITDDVSWMIQKLNRLRAKPRLLANAKYLHADSR